MGFSGHLLLYTDDDATAEVPSQTSSKFKIECWAKVKVNTRTWRPRCATRGKIFFVGAENLQNLSNRLMDHIFHTIISA